MANTLLNINYLLPQTYKEISSNEMVSCEYTHIHVHAGNPNTHTHLNSQQTHGFPWFCCVQHTWVTSQLHTLLHDKHECTTNIGSETVSSSKDLCLGGLYVWHMWYTSTHCTTHALETDIRHIVPHLNMPTKELYPRCWFPTTKSKLPDKLLHH